MDAPPRRARRAAPTVWKWTRRALQVTAILAVLLAVAAVLTIRHFEADLPSVADLKTSYHPSQTRACSRGTARSSRSSTPSGAPWSRSRSSPAPREARGARRRGPGFYEHEGLNYYGILRAHKIDEGFQVIDAVRRTKRVVQVGTQRRSAELFLEAKKIMDSRQLGEIRLVTSQWLNNQSSLSNRQLTGNLDWNQWLGTSPKRPMDPVRFFNWYYFWDYSGGLLVGQAAHILDTIAWYMGSKEPVAVTCSGGQVNLRGAEVPETATVAIEFPENYLATFTLGYKSMRYNMFNDQLMQFHGNKARLDVGRESYALYPESNSIEMKSTLDKKQPGSFSSAAPQHIRNFMECIRTRKDPNAPVEAGQATNILLCMAMDSLRAGRRLKWNSQKRQVES